MQKSTANKFAHYATMNITGMIGLSCYILADTFFISKALGTNGLAALNLAIPIYSFVHGLGLMFGIGGATKYSIFRGQKREREGNQTFSLVIVSSVIISIILLLLGLVLSGLLARALGANGEVYSMTRIYLRVILLFSPAFMLNDILVCFVRNDGSPKLAMAAMLAGSFSNILLDYIFLFPMEMGIFGAVLATGFAPVIGLSILSIHFLKKKNGFQFQKELPSILHIREPILLGIPSLVTEVASGIVMIVLNRIILGLQGNIGVAAYGVIANISLVVASIYTGLAQGMQPLTSYSHGCRDSKTVRQIFRYALWSMAVISVGLYVVIFFFADPIVLAFNGEHNANLQQMAVLGMQLYFVVIPFMGFNIITSMFLTSTEKPIPAQIISLLRGLILVIPIAYILAYAAQMVGVWLALPVTEAVVAVGAMIKISRMNE